MTDENEGSDEDEGEGLERRIRAVLDSELDFEDKRTVLRKLLTGEGEEMDEANAEGEGEAEGDGATYQRRTVGPKQTSRPAKLTPKFRPVQGGAETSPSEINFTGSKAQHGPINTVNGTIAGQSYDLSASKKRFDAAFQQEFLPSLRARFRSS